MRSKKEFIYPPRNIGKACISDPIDKHTKKQTSIARLLFCKRGLIYLLCHLIELFDQRNLSGIVGAQIGAEQVVLPLGKVVALIRFCF